MVVAIHVAIHSERLSAHLHVANLSSQLSFTEGTRCSTICCLQMAAATGAWRDFCSVEPCALV